MKIATTSTLDSAITRMIFCYTIMQHMNDKHNKKPNSDAMQNLLSCYNNNLMSMMQLFEYVKHDDSNTNIVSNHHRQEEELHI